MQWPMNPDGTDTPLLYTEEFHFPDGKARFYPLDYEFHYETDEKYDLHVNNGRLLEHFHEGNMTYKVPGLSHEQPNAFVEVSPELAKERDIKEGATVKLTSAVGEATGVVTITDRMEGNNLYLPLNDNGKSAVNLLTDNSVDKDSNTPAYKEIKVYMEVLSKQGKSPIPDWNHRRGNRQPQVSVQVQKKWERDDYTFPGSKVKQDG